jgi:hypothetical protein
VRPQNESTALAPAGDLHRAADASGRRWCSKRIVALRNKCDWPTHIVGTWNWPSSPRCGVSVRAPSPMRLRMRRNRGRWLDRSGRCGGTKVVQGFCPRGFIVTNMARPGGSQADGSGLPGARNGRRLSLNRHQSGRCRSNALVDKTAPHGTVQWSTKLIRRGLGNVSPRRMRRADSLEARPGCGCRI